MLSKATSSTSFWVFGMTRPEIESRFAGPLVNTLLIRPKYIYIYIKYIKGQKNEIKNSIEVKQSRLSLQTVSRRKTHRQQDIKLWYFKKKELKTEKKKNRTTADLDKILPELWKKGKVYDIILRWRIMEKYERLYSPLHLLYFDPRPGPKMLFQGDTPEGSDTFQWLVIERDRVGGLRLMIWDKVKVPLCHYSDAPEESNLWTAWQLFPLDDD